MQALKIFHTYRRLRKELQLQKAFNASFLEDELARLQQQYKGVFSQPLLKKIKGFYGLLVPTVLCSSYCHLAGEKFTDDERRRAMVISIMTPVYDDFFDEGTLTTKGIEEITARPQSYQADTFTEKVFKDLHSWMLENVACPEQYQQTFQDVFASQVASAQQTNIDLGEEELYKITYDKSFYSLLLYHLVLDITPAKALTEALFPIAGLLQISNDAFDVYRDLQDGIYTIPNRTGDIAGLKRKFITDVKQFNRLIADLPYPKSRKEDFLITLNFISARGWVAILQLERLLHRLPKNTNLANVERRWLICDMEKPSNIARWLFYTHRFSKLR